MTAAVTAVRALSFLYLWSLRHMGCFFSGESMTLGVEDLESACFCQLPSSETTKELCCVPVPTACLAEGCTMCVVAESVD